MKWSSNRLRQWIFSNLLPIFLKRSDYGFSTVNVNWEAEIATSLWSLVVDNIFDSYLCFFCCNFFQDFKLKNSGLVLGLLLCIISIEASLYFEEVANLTPSQRQTLSRFRSQVEDLLPHDYMKEDLYLMRFLKSKNFRLQDSISAIKEAMRWRELYDMDSIDNEDFSDFEQDFPLYFDGVDKQGRVVMESHFGEWPVRSAVVAGKLQRLNRYGVKAIEDATRKVRDLQASGKNVTQWVMLLNMDGFNVIQNACPSCLPYYLNFVSSYEKYYPFSVGHMVYVNTPEAFEIVMNLVRPLMNAQTRKVMKIFGVDEGRWKPYIDKHFSPDQISEWFGGYKIRKSRF